MAIFNPGPSLEVNNAIVEAEFNGAATLVLGDLVEMSTTEDNTVVKITSNNYDNIVVGIVVERTAPTKVKVRSMGVSNGHTGLVRGKPVFVSPTGTTTSSVPTAGSLQMLGTATSSTEMWLNISHNKVVRA